MEDRFCFVTRPALFVSIISAVYSLSEVKFQHVTCADRESFDRGVPTLMVFFLFFLVDEGREGPKPLKWCFASGPMMVQH